MDPSADGTTASGVAGSHVAEAIAAVVHVVMAKRNVQQLVYPLLEALASCPHAGATLAKVHLQLFLEVEGGAALTAFALH